MMMIKRIQFTRQPISENFIVLTVCPKIVLN